MAALLPNDVNRHRLSIHPPAGFLLYFFPVEQDSAGDFRGCRAPVDAGQDSQVIALFHDALKPVAGRQRRIIKRRVAAAFVGVAQVV